MKHAVVIAFAALAGPAMGQTGNPAVLTGQYNISRTGANLQETLLTPGNVTTSQFGKLGSWAVDGYVFAQPLYVPGVVVGGVARNVVYVSTMNNSIYAFDASQPAGTYLWKASSSSPSQGAATLEPPVLGPSANGCPAQYFTGPALGVFGTPVINHATNTLYAITATPATGGYVHYLHAIDIRTGADTATPVLIIASVTGGGYYNEPTSAGQLPMSTVQTVVQRTALLLANGSVYAGFGNCGPDNDPWHGWVVGYSTSNLTQTAVFNSTPDSGRGGIWQSGRGFAADSQGNIYLTTGNGQNDGLSDDYAESLLKLSPTGALLGNFPPKNIVNLNDYDLDFSSSGPLMIPGTANLLVAGGKDGVLYVFNGNTFGANTTSPVQSFQATQTCTTFSENGCYQIHDMAFANNNLFLWGSTDYLRSFQWNPVTSQFSTSGAVGTQVGGFHPAPLAISGNGSLSNILWAVTESSSNDPTPGTVHAYSIGANGSFTEIWNSDQNTAGRDTLPSFARWSNPTVANGNVYVATHSNQVVVYGLLASSDFSVSATPSSKVLVQGKKAAFTVRIGTQGGFISPVTFNVSGLPAGVTPSFNPTSLTGPGTSTLTLTASSSAATGSYNLIITATGGGKSHTASVTLSVTPLTVLDTAAPNWTCCTRTSGTPLQFQYTIQDTGSGLGAITPLIVYGASYSVQPFVAGTTNSVLLTVTPNSREPSYIRFQISDVAGNSTLIDPFYAIDTRNTGKPLIAVADKNLDVGESWVQIINDPVNPATNIRIDVNGVQFEEAGLINAELRTLDISSALASNQSNTLTVTFLGKPGGTALIIISDPPVQ